jgi:hypothetical protein
MPKPSSSSRPPDKPLLCPQCQAQVTKNSLNEHFVSVHGRKVAIVGQATPGSPPARGKTQSRQGDKEVEKSTPQGDSSSSAPTQGGISAEQIESELADGILRCPDCGKKVKLVLLDRHYRDAHQNQPVFKGKKGGKHKSTGPVDRPPLNADPGNKSTASE